MHQHHLEKDERQARNNRKKCRFCYENIQKEEGYVTALKSQSESQRIVKIVKKNRLCALNAATKKTFLKTFATN